MSDLYNQATRRLGQAKAMLTGNAQDPNALPWDPSSTSFPTRKLVPLQPGEPEGAAWVWGKNDYRGRLNLLTPARIKTAAATIITGETARLDLPLTVPDPPAFERERFEHSLKTVVPGKVYDDMYKLNTQSGTQWDGFRHFAHLATDQFYNNTKASDFAGEHDNLNCSVHHWSSSGFAGRAVFLDYRAYAESQGIDYDTCSRHEITYTDLEACAKHQGIDIRPLAQGGDIQPGDILLLRVGWTKDYHSRTPEQNASIAHRKASLEEPDTVYAGVKQEEAMLDWLHDCYFAAVAGDSPTFEAWPTNQSYFLHEYILSMWGMPLGEMLDLEKVSELAQKHNRWFFFFTSAPANCPGGVASHVNGTAIF